MFLRLLTAALALLRAGGEGRPARVRRVPLPGPDGRGARGREVVLPDGGRAAPACLPQRRLHLRSPGNRPSLPQEPHAQGHVPGALASLAAADSGSESEDESEGGGESEDGLEDGDSEDDDEGDY